MHSKTVSIVVPTYNRSGRIRNLASMMIDQSYRPLELIVVDDGSEDDTLLMLESVKDCLEKSGISTFFCTIPHSGQDSAMNEGLKHVTGEYFFWCDDDDLLMSDAIGAKVEWLKEHPGYGFVRSNTVQVDTYSRQVVHYPYSNPELKCTDILRYLLDDTMPCFAGTYLMRTSFLDRILPERTILLNGEGQNLQILIPAALDSECGFIDEVQMHYIVHPDGHSSKGRSLTELLARNEKFRKLKLDLLGPGREELAAIVNKRHDLCRKNILNSAVAKARSEFASDSIQK